MDEGDKRPFRGGPSFIRGLGILIAALGAVAVFGSEPAHVTITRVVGILLALAGALSLLAWASVRAKARAHELLTWSLSALAAGALVVLLPAHGMASVGVLLGVLLVFHGVATSLIAWRGWRARDVIALLASFAAPLLLIVGLALVFGVQPGERGEEIMIGVDMLLFGAYMIIGRTLLDFAEAQDSPGARPAPPSGRSP